MNRAAFELQHVDELAALGITHAEAQKFVSGQWDGQRYQTASLQESWIRWSKASCVGCPCASDDVCCGGAA